VDRQLSALANGRIVKSPRRGLSSNGTGVSTASSTPMMRLTKMATAALASTGLTMVSAQRGVCSHARGVATAVDLVCYRPSDDAIVVVEVKCGFHGVRRKPARLNGKDAFLSSPLTSCPDTALHRHLAQLAVTRHMFASERTTLNVLSKECGIGSGGVDAVLLYASEGDVELVTLPVWWRDRADTLLRKCAQ
jgi:hypothetical protein